MTDHDVTRILTRLDLHGATISFVVSILGNAPRPLVLVVGAFVFANLVRVAWVDLSAKPKERPSGRVDVTL